MKTKAFRRMPNWAKNSIKLEQAHFHLCSKYELNSTIVQKKAS